MKAISFDNKHSDIPVKISEDGTHTSVVLTKDYNYSKIKSVRFDLFDSFATNGDDGYMVIPRGKENCDYSLCYFNRHKEDFVSEITESNMPIFGYKTNDKCCLCVVSGMSYDYTLVIELKNGKYSCAIRFELYGEQPYEDLSVDIYELFGENANYSGMARKYRELKIAKFGLVPLSERIDNEPYLKYSMDSVMIRIRCGWKPAPSPVPHQNLENEPEMHVACDFKRVGQLLDELKVQGVDKAEICLVGWNVKGHDGRWPQTFPVEKDLGGEDELKALIKKAQSMGYQMTCHTNSSDQYEIADNYSYGNTCLDRNGNPVLDIPGWSGGEMQKLCPIKGLEQAKEILPKVANLGFKGTHYIDVIGVVHPLRCYSKDHYSNSKNSVNCAKELCELSRSVFGGISSEGAYDFIAPYIDYGLYISFKHDIGGVCDMPIPFWQIVYHGYVMSNPYSDTVNPTFKPRDRQLKLYEFGGRPSYYYYSVFTSNGYNWMGNEDARCDTDEQLRESVSKIKEGYEEYKKLYKYRTLFIEEHKEISENVFRVTYSDGSVLKFDYNDLTYTEE